MTRKEILFDFFKKTIFPVLAALLLYNMFIHISKPDGVTDYFILWILCGIPFGIGKMIFLPSRDSSMQFTISVLLTNFVVGGMIDGFILVWRLLVAVWYVPLTVVRFIAEHNTRKYGQ